ncbi:(2Fe-2S) ferredoxin domain-containing protein [Fictibacillus enclensis]|uniref:(2Fe-2S) ferredoxin domain-containing protein n=1 Tax=Fictibacillus enclensis TaxID=1017270 RepID=UPI0025A291C4|nr:(2Fe-2S) ferredoxin domain-containing protein [Fictibacillus enclensis]MDM5198196.1 (2Fe-2S) ferredoxin domain-containing protein [Fictibacillus enclensis]
MTTWNLNGTMSHVLICNGSSCMRKGGEEVTQAIRDEIKKQELDQQVHTTRTRCNGRCKDACVAIIYPEGTWYSVPDEEAARKLVTNHLGKGEKMIQHVIYEYGEEGFCLEAENGWTTGVEKVKEKEAVK